MSCWSMTIAVHENFWKLARIKSLVVGTNGRTWGAIVRIASTGTCEYTLQRPLQQLYPLETRSLNPAKDEETNDEKGVPAKEKEEDRDPMSARSKISKETCGSNRPTRAVAQRSRDRTLAIALSEQKEYSD